MLHLSFVFCWWPLNYLAYCDLFSQSTLWIGIESRLHAYREPFTFKCLKVADVKLTELPQLVDKISRYTHSYANLTYFRVCSRSYYISFYLLFIVTQKWANQPNKSMLAPLKLIFFCIPTKFPLLLLTLYLHQWAHSHGQLSCQHIFGMWNESGADGGNHMVTGRAGKLHAESSWGQDWQ